MTRGKNSRRFRTIGKDFRGEKKKENHVENPETAILIVTCNKVARSLIEYAGLPQRGAEISIITRSSTRQRCTPSR